MARKPLKHPDQLQGDPSDEVESFERIRHRKDGALPVSSRGKANSASRKTEGSRRASKRIARQRGGISRRRTKKYL